MTAKKKDSSNSQKAKATSPPKRRVKAKACVKALDKRFVAKSGRGISVGNSLAQDSTSTIRRANDHMLRAWQTIYQKRAK